MNQQSKVAVIGAGVMGEALIAALISYGVKPELITISEKRDERAAELITKYSIKAAPLAANVSSAAVVPLGLVTFSRNVVALLPDSPSNLAAPTMVCTVRVVEFSARSICSVNCNSSCS